jgi:hypothetical protein
MKNVNCEIPYTRQPLAGEFYCKANNSSPAGRWRL